MNPTITTACCVAFVFGATSAGAAMITGQPYRVPLSGEVSISFLSQDAGAKGSLYFLGAQNDGAISYRTNSDARLLGQHLFTNHGTARGTSVNLGLFSAGTTLHFAYTVTTGMPGVPTGTTSRTDFADDLRYFGLETVFSSGGRVETVFSVEDIKDPRRTDWDYNDFRATITAIPTPGVAMALASGFALVSFRRSRRA